MLSDHEKRELALIEQELQDDPGCVRSARWLKDPLARHLWKVRAAIGFGAFVLLAGMILNSGTLVAQGGLIVVAVGFGWLHIRTWKAPPSRQRDARHHSAWFRD